MEYILDLIKISKKKLAGPKFKVSRFVVMDVRQKKADPKLLHI